MCRKQESFLNYENLIKLECFKDPFDDLKLVVVNRKFKEILFGNIFEVSVHTCSCDKLKLSFKSL